MSSGDEKLWDLLFEVVLQTDYPLSWPEQDSRSLQISFRIPHVFLVIIKSPP
jgi:hypothetical protein